MSFAPVLLLPALPAQKLRWQFGPYDAAHFERKVSWKETVLEPTGMSFSSSGAAPAAGLPGKDLVKNGSFESVRGKNPVHWGRRVFRGEGKLEVDAKVARAGKRSLRITSPAALDAAFIHKVEVTPERRYRLEGFVRTSGVGTGGGAQLGVLHLGRSGLTEAVRGEGDWTAVRVDFDSGDRKEVYLVCSLGAFEESKGTAWFDGVTLREIAAPPRPSDTLRTSLFRGRRRPPLIRGNDLDERREAPAFPLEDLRDLPALLALDLGRARSVTVRRQTAEVRGFEPIWYETRYASVLDGKQTVRVRVGTGRRRRGGRADAEAVPPAKVTGEILIERQIDADGQRIRRFTARSDWQVELPAGGGALPGVERCALTCEETWTWLRDSAPNDSHFKARVNEAIRKGARHLRGEYAGKRSAAGRHALMVLTLLKAGEDPRDPLMRTLLKQLRRRGLKNTYDLAVSIMALEALYAPPDERDMLTSGRLTKPMPRELNPEDRALMQEWVDVLVNNVDLRVDPAYLRRWNYTPAKRFDNSNCQYALLGLYTASLCGVEISAQVWFAAARHWLEVQGKPEKDAVQLQLVTRHELYEREHRAGAREASSRRTVSRGVAVQPRGWGYGAKGSKATGSMTTAGITGLVICDAALDQQKKGTRKLRSEVDAAIEAGFAWLARHFSVTENPGGGARWHYYYLYGLERACELRGVAIFQGRRWYTEGAEHLLAAQGKDGAWANLEDTCFAILFLKKAAPPVITGPR